MPERTYYDILRISQTASEEEIKAAYRALAWNPSAVANQEEVKLVNEAYATLSSPSRREAYDRTLSAEPAAVPESIHTNTAQPPAPEPAPEPIPKGPLLHRAWGVVSEMVLLIARVRYVVIPFTVVLSVMLIGFGFFLAGRYMDAVAQPPAKVSIHDLTQGVPERRYVAVIGTADYKNGYESKGDVNKKYYLLVMGNDILVFSGPTGRASGPTAPPAAHVAGGAFFIDQGAHLKPIASPRPGFKPPGEFIQGRYFLYVRRSG